MIENINKKIIANAVSAYLLIFVCGLFFINKTNSSLNNDFVKKHVKSALIIHFLFLFTYIVFVHNHVLSSINILGFSLNEIITPICFLLILILLIVGIYKANTGNYFSSFEAIGTIKIHIGPLGSKENAIDINGDGVFSEKDKVTLIISHIPFLGFLNFGKYSKNTFIINNTKANSIITSFIILLYLSQHANLANLMLLAYLIFIAFSGINLFVRDEIIKLNLEKIPNGHELLCLIKSFFQYISHYYGKDESFKNFSVLLAENRKKQEENHANDMNVINTLPDSKMPPILTYIPYINLIFLFKKQNKLHFHICNGITLSFLLIISQIFSYFGWFNIDYAVFLLFPLCFGYSFLKKDLVYKIPFIYNIYAIFYRMTHFVKFSSARMNEKRKEVNEVSLKKGE